MAMRYPEYECIHLPKLKTPLLGYRMETVEITTQDRYLYLPTINAYKPIQVIYIQYNIIH